MVHQKEPIKEVIPVERGATIRVAPDISLEQYKKNVADQKKIKYEPHIKPKPGCLPIHDPHADRRHGVPRNPRTVTPIPHKKDNWEGKSIEFLDYIVDEEDE